MFSSLAEDIEDFAAEYNGDVEFVRLAVTPEQARLYGLPSAPPKATDNRRFDGDETWPRFEAIEFELMPTAALGKPPLLEREPSLPRPPGARDIARRPSPRLSVEAKSPTGAAGIASSRGVLTTSFLTQTAVADVFVQWTFENAQFSDGGALTGFDFDATIGAVTDWSVALPSRLAIPRNHEIKFQTCFTIGASEERLKRHERIES